MRNIGIRRHWHDGSEKYTVGDSLVTVLQDGFEISKVVIQARPLYGWRTATIYHFQLNRGEITVVMSVIGNPFVARLAASSAFPVVFPVEYEHVQEQVRC
jgi:hypothetical protein